MDKSATETQTSPPKPMTAAEAAAELKANYAEIAKAVAFVHERTQEETISVWVTNWDVLEKVPQDSEGRYKGFPIIWGFYIPDGVILQ